MTPLQQAAKAVIDCWDSPRLLTDSECEELRKALDAEIAQSVEPVAHFNIAINETVGCIAYEYGKHNLKSGTPLYLHPPQQQAVVVDLVKALNAFLTHMGMDEDEWNKPTFNQARAAIAKAQGELK